MLDRDGVINEDSDAFIKSPQEWLPIPGSIEAIAKLYQNGFNIVVITNQSGLARGLFDSECLRRIHDKMRITIEAAGGKIEAVYFCPHAPEDGCKCRKPKPGLLNEFAEQKHVELVNIPFVGDSFRDIQAARAVRASPILVKTGKGAKTLIEHPNLNIPVFENLYDATEYILSKQ